MKRCPACGQTYTDDLSFCLSDGTPLVPLVIEAEEQTVVRRSPAANAGSSGGSAFKYIAAGLAALLLVVLVAAGALLWMVLSPEQTQPAGNAAKNPNTASTAAPQPSLQATNTPDLKQKEDELERERRRLADERKKLEADKLRSEGPAATPAPDEPAFNDPGTARIAFSRGSTGQTISGTVARSRSYVLRTLAGQFLTATVRSPGGCVAFAGGGTSTSMNTPGGDTFLNVRNTCDSPTKFTLTVNVK